MYPHTLNRGTGINRHSATYLFCGETRPLKGGIQCRRLPDKDGRPKPGTLGYIVSGKSNNEKLILSCEHVLGFKIKDDKTIFQPDYSKCAGIYYHDVGKAQNGIVGHRTLAGSTDVYFMDAAIATIDSGIAAIPGIPKVGAIAGAGNLINAALIPEITVKKMGALTGYTEGIVRKVDHNEHGAQNLIVIEPKPGKTFTYKEKRKIHPDAVDFVLDQYPVQSMGGTATLVDAAEGMVEFKVEVFAIPGDSGAMVVRGTEVVGMVLAGEMFEAPAFDFDTKKWRKVGVPKGSVFAMHIQPVLEHLAIKIDPAAAISSGEEIEVPTEEVDSPGLESLNHKLSRLEQKLSISSSGRDLINVMQNLFPEFVQLIHHTRSVKVVWHRFQGPAFTAYFFRCIANPDLTIPPEINGIPTLILLRKLDGILTKEGSADLILAIDTYRPLIYDLVENGQSINEMIEKIHSHFWIPEQNMS